MIINDLKINKKFSCSFKRGFTLIELMVATTIFSMIMLVSIGSLIMTLGIAKNYRALNFAMDNVNFAMESMTRSIRMGTNYFCVQEGGEIQMEENPFETKDCERTDDENGRGTFLAFIPQESDGKIRVGYKFTKRDDDSGTYTIERCEGRICVPIISPDVNIEKLNFIVKGSSPDDQTQASVYILIKGNIVVRGVANSFALQTMASQRNF